MGLGACGCFVHRSAPEGPAGCGLGMYILPCRRRVCKLNAVDVSGEKMLFHNRVLRNLSEHDWSMIGGNCGPRAKSVLLIH